MQPIDHGHAKSLLVRNGRVYAVSFPQPPLLHRLAHLSRASRKQSSNPKLIHTSPISHISTKRRAGMPAVTRSQAARAKIQEVPESMSQNEAQTEPEQSAAEQETSQPAQTIQPAPEEAQPEPASDNSTRTLQKKPLTSVAASKSLIASQNRVSKIRRLHIKTSAQAVFEKRRKNAAFKNPGPRRPNGLYNPSNYCYRRSILQALFHQPVFLSWLEQCRSSHGTHSRNTSCLPCSLARLSSAVWSSAKTTNAEVTSFDHALRALRSSNTAQSWLSNSSQADANEALGFILNQLPNSLTTQRLFQITTGSEWTCPDCWSIHTSRLTAEIGISLGLPDGRSGNLADFIPTHFAAPVDEMGCELPACRSRGTRTRVSTIFAAPDILIIQLKRFSCHYDPRRGSVSTRKNRMRVSYGAELDLSAYADASALAAGPLKYRLQAVVAHSGSLDVGHYVAYCRGPECVMHISDSVVSRASEQEMLAPEDGFDPYILFYGAM